jgi:hypothetical protein
MADDAFEVEADTLQEAKDLAYARVSDGQRAEIEVLCDGRSVPRVTREIVVESSSEAMARHLAQGKIPDGFKEISLRALTQQKTGSTVAAAADEESAYREAKRLVPPGAVCLNPKVRSRQVERTQAYNADARDRKEAQRWVARLQAELGGGHRVENLREERVVAKRWWGLLKTESSVFVADVETTRSVEVELPFRSTIEYSMIVGTDFYNPKAKISARIVDDDLAAAELRRHPDLVAALAALPVSDTNHDFFSERYDHDHDLYVAPSRSAFETLGPVRMALRVVAFLGQRSFDGRRRVSSRWQVGGGMLVASFTTHYDDIPGSGNHVESLLVLRVDEDKYTDFTGRFQKG